MNKSKKLIHFEDKEYKDILNQTNKRCFYCGRYAKYFHIEDVRSEYTLYFDDVAVCERCYTVKGVRSLNEYKNYIIDTITQLKRNYKFSLFFELGLLHRTDKHVLFYGERISDSKGNDHEIITNIKKQVSDYYSLTTKMLDTPTRKTHIVWPRQVAHYFARHKSGASLQTIGDEIGRVDHATILNSIKTVRNLYDTDPKKKKEIDFLDKIFDSVI